MVLAEKNHYPGGVATSGLMCSMSNYFVTRDGTQVTTGLPIEFVDRLVSECGAMKGYLRPTQPQIPNDPEVVKRVMIKMLREYGVFHLPHGGGNAISVVKQALDNGNYPDHFGEHATNMARFGLFSARCNRGTVLINSNWFYGDCYDVIAESEREEEGRLLAEVQAEFLIKHFPGFENAYLLETATEIGHRILRTFLGKSTLSADDFKDGKRLPDVVGLVTEVDRRA